MKKLATFSIALTLTFIFYVYLAVAQIQFYSVSADLDKEGKVWVKKIITFSGPEQTFEFSVFGKILNLTAKSNAGPVYCELRSEAISIVKCSMNLTAEKRTLELSYETFDFVKKTDKTFYFNGDFSVYKDIDSSYFAVMLPEGTVISEDKDIKPILPENYQTLSDGRRIIVQWNLENISRSQALKFQVAYEQLTTTVSLNLLQILMISFFVVLATVFFLYRKIRKPEEVILSVLDENERKVIEIINAAGGEVSQKKIVQDTNLSKAKVSRLIKGLLERGLIEVRRIGRTNKIKLSKSKFVK